MQSNSQHSRSGHREGEEGGEGAAEEEAEEGGEGEEEEEEEEEDVSKFNSHRTIKYPHMRLVCLSSPCYCYRTSDNTF